MGKKKSFKNDLTLSEPTGTVKDKPEVHPSFIDGEVVLGSHCFCGFYGGRPDNTDEKHNYREHLRHCPLYKVWIEKIFPLEEMALKIPIEKLEECQFCKFSIYIKLAHYKMCVRCHRPFSALGEPPFIKKAKSNGSCK